MKKIENLTDIDSESISITIGNFDGVHSGHQEIIKNIKKRCEKNGSSFVLITFNPHPLRILRPKDNFLINTYEEKFELLSTLGVDYYYEIPFTRDLSTLSPTQFLEDYIFVNKSLKYIYMGHDFAFGANKEGDFNFVSKFCENVDVIKLEEFKNDETNISSSKIRSLIEVGDIECTNKLLNRSFYLNGTVIKGAGRGRQIGFPTANIDYSCERITPAIGVYVTSVEVRGMIYHSITNIGINPTFKESSEKTVETNIFDFSEDIYGEELKVLFHKRVRNEKKFSSVNELVEQISKDVLEAKEFFKNL
jgi:riboflavin kinase/FMN adenylyltransferase